MKKYIFTESQIKHIIDGVIEEGNPMPSSPTKKTPLQPATIDNMIKRGAKINPADTVGSNYKSQTPVAKKAGKYPKAVKSSGVATKTGGGLSSTGKNHIPKCAGGGCGNLREQQEEQKQTKAVQNFLNTRLKANLKVDGLVGPVTKQAIEKYQQIIGVYPTDGVWGQDTYDKMPKNDKKIYDDYLNAGGDIIDKVLNLLR